MGEMIQIHVEEGERWNSCVRSFQNYDVFYLHEYVLAFMNENEKNGVPVLLYYENGADRAINVVFKRDVALDENIIIIANNVVQKDFSLFFIKIPPILFYVKYYTTIFYHNFL